MTEEGNKKFVYSEAVASLEKIAAAVEDPATSLEDIEKYISQADSLIAGCRNYLRSAREKVSNLETNQPW